MRRLAAAWCLLALGQLRAQFVPPLELNVSADRPPGSLLKTLDALGANSSIPDGIGGEIWRSASVIGQPTKMALAQSQVGVSFPISSSDGQQWFGNVSARLLDGTGSVFLPDSAVPFPNQLWDISAGALYINRQNPDFDYGVQAGVGSAGDRPFASHRDMLYSALGFVRMPANETSGWLFYVLSSSNGQVGRNIPIPGVGYDFHSGPVSGVVGLPFVHLAWDINDDWRTEFSYAAITDIDTRIERRLARRLLAFGGFEWTNQSWFRHGRAIGADQLFWYEKRLQSGLEWTPIEHFRFSAVGGWAFDRLFVENSGIGFCGRNRLDLGSTPFLKLQLHWDF